jgi:hypothetical protein
VEADPIWRNRMLVAWELESVAQAAREQRARRAAARERREQARAEKWDRWRLMRPLTGESAAVNEGGG